MRSFLVLLFIFFFSSILWQCAGQAPPEGGPKDLEPPNIIGVFPEPNSTNVETDVIRFQFSKYVDRSSFQQGLFISPIIDDIETIWRGRSVELKIHEPLRENTTYSITVGTELRDTREGTRLNDAFTLAFSTGDEIDKGQITGKVYFDEPVGVLIFAYQLYDSLTADTLNPSDHKPDYITQTGRDGDFRLPYLRLGTFRIIALRDEFQSRLYDRDVDPYGVYVRDVTITEVNPYYEDLAIRMHKPDFTKPFLSRVTAMHHSKISVRFSKPIDPASVSLQSFRIGHNDTGEILELYGSSIRKENPAELYLFTSRQNEGTYTLSVDSTVTDLHGNNMMSNGLVEIFEGKPDEPDTPITPEYVSPQRDAMNVRPDTPVTLQFSYPVKSDTTENAIILIDTNDVILTGDYLWDDDATVTFIPSHLMESKMVYRILVGLDRLPDKYGLSYEDSLFASRFTVMDRDMLGAIEGELITQQDTTFTITFDRLGSTRERYLLTQKGGGLFRIGNIPEGQYTIWAFRDEDGDGEYYYGEVFPFTGSDPFIIHPDTVRVRARWTVDGIIMDMRKYDDNMRVELPDR
jgi:hypothetical protein